MNITSTLSKVPLLGPLLLKSALHVKRKSFHGSDDYWKRRYDTAGNSGAGSYDKFAEFKGEVIERLIEENGIQSAIEFGSGDGNQLHFIKYPRYTGVDISEQAVALCREAFAKDSTKNFLTLEEYQGEKAEMSLSLDVLYHLVEQEVFETYLTTLFAAGEKLVVIYASNTDEQEEFQPPHVFHREFTRWVEQNEPGWELLEHIPNRYPYEGDHKTGSFADFYIYRKTA